MGRIFVIALAIALPFALYALWQFAERKRLQAEVQGKTGTFSSWPFGWLILASLILIILSFLAMRIFGWDPDGWIGGPSLIQRDLESR